MPGGTLIVRVMPHEEVVLTGPVEVVGRMHFHPKWISAFPVMMIVLIAPHE